jgi:hypothetical protein
VLLEGDGQGYLDLQSWRGEIHGPDLLTAADALLRLGLSLLAPASGWLLLHGAAIAMEDGQWALLIGASRAGKSTASRAFRSFCDEMVLVRPGPDRPTAASTPYWNGEAGTGTCGAIVCLQRNATPHFRRLRGTQAVRAVLPHLMRHVRLETADVQIVERLCRLVRQVPVLEVCCPEGDEYLPFLMDALDQLGLPPLERKS